MSRRRAPIAPNRPTVAPVQSGIPAWPYRAASAAALIALAVLCFFPIQSDDLFMYLAIGRRVVQERAFPRVDPFLYSIPNYHWHVTHEWASHLLAYATYGIGGWTGLIALKTAIVLAIAAVTLWVARRLALRSSLVPLMLLLAGIAGYHRLIERSSLASDLLTAVVLAVLIVEREARSADGRGTRLKYALPLLFLCWTNLHPGYYTGLALCALALVCDWPRWRQPGYRRLAKCAAASVVACMINPDGLAGFVYPLRPVFDRTWEVYRQFNFEWMPTLSPGYAGTIGVKAYIAIVAICCVLALLALPRRPWFELAAGAFLVWLGFSAIRFVPTASFSLAIVATSLMAKSPIARASPNFRRRVGVYAGCAVGVACIAFAARVAIYGHETLAGPRRPGTGLDARVHPERAAELIERIGLDTNLFNDHSFGSYLAWRWDGRRKLFYHGFVDDLVFYRRNFLAVNESPEEFARIVDEFKIGAFLLTPPPRSAGGLPLLYHTLLTGPQWRVVHADESAILFLRDIPENQVALARCGSVRQ